MTLEQFNWALGGALIAGCLFAPFYHWSNCVLTAKWMAVTKKNWLTAQASVQRAFNSGYAMGLKDANYDAGKTTRTDDFEFYFGKEPRNA